MKEMPQYHSVPYDRSPEKLFYGQNIDIYTYFVWKHTPLDLILIPALTILHIRKALTSIYTCIFHVWRN